MSDFNDLCVGDRVVLNSGGPLMTVESLLPGGEHVECVWFQSNSVLCVDAGELLVYGSPQRINLPASAVTKMAV